MRFPSPTVALLALGAVTAIGCSVEVKHDHRESDASYSYALNDNGCDTGKRSFSDHDAYCRTLLDDGANSGCAHDMRQQLWNKDCR